MMTITEINAALADRIADLAPALLGPPNPALSTRRQMRFGRKGSLVVEIAGPKRGAWFSHELGVGGDALGLTQHVVGRRDAIAWAERFIGTVSPIRTYKLKSGTGTKNSMSETSGKKRWSSYAESFWSARQSLKGSIAQTYLESRGCAVPDCEDLAFCPDYRGYPALMARVTDPATNAPVSLHFTLLRPDGSGKADVDKPKLFLPSHIAKGVVRLVDDAEMTIGLGIAEGLENALDVMRKGWSPVWSTLSAGNLASFPLLSGVECLTVFGDCDASGGGQRAAEKVVRRWREAGREARIVLPPEVGMDWNDLSRRAG